MFGQTLHPDAAARCYVIGDIHGRLDLLDNMIELIARDVAHGNADRSLTVTLGDYVDRGLNSSGVLDRLATNPFPTPYVALKGNHELMLEQFLEDPSTAENWSRFGGLETLYSYGISVDEVKIGKGFERASEMLRAVIPREHLDFLSSLKTSLNLKKFFLCHAGVRPGVALDCQSDEDLLWIRTDFLDSHVDFGKIVVHGHTPCEWPEDLPNRINIDTGAYITGRLTSVVLDGESYRFIFTQ
jgi:serine/threonine protein phosphatase 1